MSTHVIGQRLTQLRKELAGPGEKPWSQTRLAEAAGVTRNIVVRLEHLGAGGIDMLQAVLTFYYTRGFNPSWVLLVDNSAVPKRLPPAGTKTIEAAVVVARVTEFADNLKRRFDQMQQELLAS